MRLQRTDGRGPGFSRLESGAVGALADRALELARLSLLAERSPRTSL
jgi:hypothetical protein